MQRHPALRQTNSHRTQSSSRRRGKPNNAIEVLEPRRLLSTTVSATDLNPPLTAGVSWTYQFTGGITGTQTQTVIGPATFNGNSATEVDAVNNFTSPATVMTTVKNYLAFTSQGLIEYGTVTIASGMTTTQTITPPLIEFPSTLTVGMPVTNTYSYSSGATETITLTLVSGTPQQVTVPAGTYSAYEVDNSSTGTGGGMVQSWFAPGVGVVKQVINTGTPVTEELTSFTGPSGGGGGGGGGGTGTGTVTSALKSPLPASVVATTPLSARDSLTLTATNAARGAVSAQVLLSPDTSAADSIFTLASGRTSLNLASGKSRALPLRFAKSIPASVAPGTYNVLLVTTDPTGATQTSVSQQLTVAPSTVDLTGSIIKAPATAKGGRKVPVTFTITNSSAANVAAVGAVQIEFETSPDGLLADASPLDLVTKRINLKPGRNVRFTMSLALSTTSFVVVNVDPGNAAFPNDVNPANNVFATPQAIVMA
jgi:hypothetical protein